MSGLSTNALFVAFGGAALIILVLGARMARLADGIADRTGFGEALVGAVLLGAGTSIPGIVASVWSASEGYPALSVSNAIGGIAAQTAFLALADMFYRRANLEHAAASAVNLIQVTILIVLMALPIAAAAGPEATVLGVHPVSPILVLIYFVGLHNAHRQKLRPMWRPRMTDATRKDDPDPVHLDSSKLRLFSEFLLLVAIVGVCGYVIGDAGLALASRFGLSETFVGALITAVGTSLPELVTTIAAVRAGAPQLAVGGIVGGNMFDALFVAASDVAYRGGSIYHAIGGGEIFWYSVVILMTAVLLIGMIGRERRGPAGIGWESSLLLGIYVAAVSLQVFAG